MEQRGINLATKVDTDRLPVAVIKIMWLSGWVAPLTTKLVTRMLFLVGLTLLSTDVSPKL